MEAARSGEAGAGFAVVAEEVRALALRSADAARDSAARIAQGNQKSQKGADISREISLALGSITQRARQLDRAMEGIVQAVQEEQQNLNEISRAVLELDEVTQKNAAASEETAAAIEEVNGRAIDMGRIAHHLRGILDGHASSPEAPTARLDEFRSPLATLHG